MSIWIDYAIEQGPNGFRVKGDWDKEVMGYDADGNKSNTKGTLYEEGDVYIVGADGWLRKVDKLSEMVFNYKRNKNEC